MSGKRELFVGITSGLAALLIICGVAGWLGWQGVTLFFQQQYYRQAYEPIELAADAIEKLAATFEERGAKINLAEIRSGIEAAVYIRRDNAAYLREAFPGESDVERAADLFDQATGDYEAVLETTSDGIADQAEAEQIAAWLRNAATAEREAGQIFLARGP